MNENQSSWENSLNPTVLRERLIAASLYIAAFELLKTAIIDRIKSFYIGGFDQSGMRIAPEYQSDVLVRTGIAKQSFDIWIGCQKRISGLCGAMKISTIEGEVDSFTISAVIGPQSEQRQDPRTKPPAFLIATR